jgi:hypothetical protein
MKIKKIILKKLMMEMILDLEVLRNLKEIFTNQKLKN